MKLWDKCIADPCPFEKFVVHYAPVPKHEQDDKMIMGNFCLFLYVSFLDYIVTDFFYMLTCLYSLVTGPFFAEVMMAFSQ